MNIVLKMTIETNGEEIDVFKFTQDGNGHLDVQTTDKGALLAAVRRVEEMLLFVRAEIGDE